MRATGSEPVIRETCPELSQVEASSGPVRAISVGSDFAVDVMPRLARSVIAADFSDSRKS